MYYKDIKPNDKLNYTEDGQVYIVQIIENNSTVKWWKFKFKFLQVIIETGIYKSVKMGEVINVTQIKNCGNWRGMWILER